MMCSTTMRTGDESGDERAGDPGAEGSPPRGRQADAEVLIRELFAEGGPLCQVMPGYGRRPEQEAFALAALESLSRGGVLLADVPTGTGKSMGYLAAAVLSGKRAAVSTATIALQGQLLEEDLLVLRRAVALLLGYPPDEGFTFAVMKGRPNFLCDQRLEDTLNAGSILDGALLGRPRAVGRRHGDGRPGGPGFSRARLGLARGGLRRGGLRPEGLFVPGEVPLLRDKRRRGRGAAPGAGGREFGLQRRTLTILLARDGLGFIGGKARSSLRQS